MPTTEYHESPMFSDFADLARACFGVPYVSVERPNQEPAIYPRAFIDQFEPGVLVVTSSEYPEYRELAIFQAGDWTSATLYDRNQHPAMFTEAPRDHV